MKKVKQKKSNNKLSLRMIFLFLTFEFVFTTVVFIPYMFYGPFKKVRNNIVETAMATGNHQYIAKLFFNQKEIQDILNQEAKAVNSNSASQKSNGSKVNIAKTDDEIERMDISTSKFNGIALIIHDPSKVKVGYAAKLGYVGETTHDMAGRYKAVAAINGGGFSDVAPNGKSGGVGAIPTGVVMSNAKVIYPFKKSEYGQKESCVLAINNKGYMTIGPASVNDLLNNNTSEAVSFSPTLILNGKAYISDTALSGVNPRTAIGQKANGNIIFVVIDGRQGLKLGATLKDVQKVMIDLGAVNAMCLDGGGSTAMYYNGEIINRPSNSAGERAVPTIVYVEP